MEKFWNVYDRHTNRVWGEVYAATERAAIVSWLQSINQEVTEFNIGLLGVNIT